MQYCSNGLALNMADYLECCFPLREDQKPTVIIKCGKIVGKLRETQNGRDFIAFTSIPYAEPPQGKKMKDFIILESEYLSFLFEFIENKYVFD